VSETNTLSMNAAESSIIPTAPVKAWIARLRTHGWALLGLLLCQLGQVLAALLLPGFSADVIDKALPPSLLTRS